LLEGKGIAKAMPFYLEIKIVLSFLLNEVTFFIFVRNNLNRFQKQF